MYPADIFYGATFCDYFPVFSLKYDCPLRELSCRMSYIFIGVSYREMELDKSSRFVCNNFYIYSLLFYSPESEIYHFNFISKLIAQIPENLFRVLQALIFRATTH